MVKFKELVQLVSKLHAFSIITSKKDQGPPYFAHWVSSVRRAPRASTYCPNSLEFTKDPTMLYDSTYRVRWTPDFVVKMRIGARKPAFLINSVISCPALRFVYETPLRLNSVRTWSDTKRMSAGLSCFLRNSVGWEIESYYFISLVTVSRFQFLGTYFDWFWSKFSLQTLTRSEPRLYQPCVLWVLAVLSLGYHCLSRWARGEQDLKIFKKKGSLVNDKSII